MRTVFYSLITLRKEEPSIAKLYGVIGAFEGRNCEKTTPNEEGKSALSPRECTVYKSNATMAKLHELHFELLPHPPYSRDLSPNDYYLFADPKRMLQGKRFGSNEEVIAETEAYFEAKDKSFYKKVIEMLEKHWDECITFEEDYVDESSRILPKIDDLFVILRTY